MTAFNLACPHIYPSCVVGVVDVSVSGYYLPEASVRLHFAAQASFRSRSVSVSARGLRELKGLF